MTTLEQNALEEEQAIDWTGPLTATGNLRRRAMISRFVEVVASGSALLGVAMLALVVIAVIGHGASQLSLSFVFSNPIGLVGGGIFNALVGTILIVAFGALIAIPVGVLTGIYLTEFAGAQSRSGHMLKTALDVMAGLPTIVVGLFVYGLIVIPAHTQTGFAGSIALAIVMLPLIARSSQEVLLLVPGSLRDAADALGIQRWRTVRGVILPAAMGGIATGAILAIARAAGETAPLLIVDSIYNNQQTQLMIFGHGVPNIPVMILTVSDLADPEAFARAWGAALVLLAFILLANVGARVLLARSRARMIG